MTKRKVVKVLERSEASALLAAPNTRCPTGLRNRAMLELMYRAGLRVGEVCALKEVDVDWERGSLTVRDGKSGDRRVELDERAAGWIRTWLASARRPGSAHVFCTLRGTALSTRYVEAMVDREARKAGIERHVHPHMLRHTFATEYSEDGGPLPDLQRILGHAHASTTADMYVHARPSKRAVEFMRQRAGQPQEEADLQEEAQELLDKIAKLPAQTRSLLAELLTEKTK